MVEERVEPGKTSMGLINIDWLNKLNWQRTLSPQAAI